MSGFLYPPGTNTTSSGGGGANIPGASQDALAGGSHNDYLPTGFAKAKAKVFFTLAGAATLTGLAQSNFTDGFEVLLVNFAGGFNLTLNFSDGASLAANQFFGLGGAGNSLIVPPGGSQLLVYSTLAGWVLV